jgi:hypothetical protein
LNVILPYFMFTISNQTMYKQTNDPKEK